MAAKKLLGSLPCSFRLPAAKSASLPALHRRRALSSQAVPAAGENAEVEHYYKNMQDSLLEIYNAGSSVSDKGGAMSVTRFMNVGVRKKCATSFMFC